MEKELYRALLPLVNDKAAMEILEKYAKARIELRRDQLEQTLHPERFREAQGAIGELRRILTLRDEVREGARHANQR